MHTTPLLPPCTLVNSFTIVWFKSSAFASCTVILPLESPTANNCLLAWCLFFLESYNHAIHVASLLFSSSFFFNCIIPIMSKLFTSKTFAEPSSPSVTTLVPHFEQSIPTITPTCARKCFANSTPFARFFQNFTCPSLLAETKKSDSLVEHCNTCETQSRCM